MTLVILIIIICLFYYKDKGVPIFLYHQVNDKSNVTPQLFEEHLKILKEKNIKTLTISELEEKKEKGNYALITLDDGYYDNYKYVYPLLKKYNMKATIFLNTLYIGETRNGETEIFGNGEANYRAMEKYLSTGDGTSEQYMTWEEIREMKKSGLVEFQAHSHKHTAVFSNDRLEGVFSGNEKDVTDLYLYGTIKKNYPKISKRGEYATEGIIIKKEFFEKFREFYEARIEKGCSNMQKIGQQFIDENKKQYFHYETEEEFFKRVEEDFLKNKELIEKNLNQKVTYFCWPWGHRNKKTIGILEKYGVKGFVTTKKGTNALNTNLKMIRRIELRKFTPEKFKLNLFIGRNYFLGKIYGWLS